MLSPVCASPPTAPGDPPYNFENVTPAGDNHAQTEEKVVQELPTGASHLNLLRQLRFYASGTHRRL